MDLNNSERNSRGMRFGHSEHVCPANNGERPPLAKVGKLGKLKMEQEQLLSKI